MRFNYVIGNPPYMQTVGKTSSQTQGNSNWVYQYFQKLADDLSTEGECLIYPFGGWFDSPERLGGFGKEVLSDEHTSLIAAFEGTSDRRAWYRNDKEPQPVFGNNANLSAGVSIVCRDHKEHDKFKYFNRVYSDKIVPVDVKNGCDLPPNPEFYGISIKLTGDKLNTAIKKGIFGIESNFVSLNPDKVSQNKDDWNNPIRLLTNDKAGSSGRATWFWTDKDNIPKGQEYIGKYKVITTSAYPKQKFSSGKPTVENVHKRLGELIELLPPGTAFGRSRLLLFSSDKKEECENYVKYTQTKFFAGLTLQEPNRCSSFGFLIPLQDFTANSDIDWSASVADIDKQLYKKYGLSEDEIQFIESRAKEME